ncbi:MAG TPA: hypothetical protein VLJ79_06190 [Candidatus Binatia bacterium]|nr:hypothetical protein [Candidatus Binatia bacterium]
MNGHASGQSQSRVKSKGVQTTGHRSTVNRVIDADSHVLEPPDMWAQYLEPEFRDKAPYFIKDEQGASTWSRMGWSMIESLIRKQDGQPGDPVALTPTNG